MCTHVTVRHVYKFSISDGYAGPVLILILVMVTAFEQATHTAL